jgi:hypothetical protein
MGMNKNIMIHEKPKKRLGRALDASLPILKNNAPTSSPRKKCAAIFRYMFFCEHTEKSAQLDVF